MNRAFAFDIYLNEESGCPDEDIDIVCEEQVVGDCCNGDEDTLYSSAQASDGQGGVVLYGLGQGQDADADNRCSIFLTQDDTCATSDVPNGSAAGALGETGGDEDPSTDGDSTDGDEDGEDDGGGDHDDGIFKGRRARRASPEKETWIQKNKKVTKRSGGWRQQQYTAYAVRNETHVYKLSRDSPHAAKYKSLTDRKERVDFIKQHGVAKLR
nr:hypothetical protein CFP56_63946 [Quercus suber]